MQAVITFNILLVFTFTSTCSSSASPKCEASFLQLAAYNVCLNIIVQLMPD